MVDHFIDALTARNGGAIDNGAAITPIHGENRTTSSPTPFGPLTVKRVAISGWSCDTCHTLGEGWKDLERHYGRTEHRTYTEMR